MKSWIFLIALVLGGCCGGVGQIKCEDPDQDPDGGYPEATCEEACVWLRELGCAEADAAPWDDADVPACETQCDVSLIPGCVVSVTACEDVQKCVDPDK